MYTEEEMNESINCLEKQVDNHEEALAYILSVLLESSFLSDLEKDDIQDALNLFNRPIA